MADSSPGDSDTESYSSNATASILPARVRSRYFHEPSLRVFALQFLVAHPSRHLGRYLCILQLPGPALSFHS